MFRSHLRLAIRQWPLVPEKNLRCLLVKIMVLQVVSAWNRFVIFEMS
jgi:hypothetical protein